MCRKNSLSYFPSPPGIIAALIWALLMLILVCPLPNTALAIAPDLLSQLTPDEIRWFDENKGLIRYAPNPSWPPGDFIENGTHKGIVADYIRIFEKKLGVTFQRVFFDSWIDILNGLKAGEVDFIGAIRKTKERELYMDFTKPFLKTRFSVVVQAESPNDLSKDSLNSMTIACPEGYASLGYFRKSFPTTKIVETRDDLDALLRVSAGAADGAVVGYMVSSYLIEKYAITNLRFGMELDFNWDLNFSVRKDLPELRSILDKALGTISKEQRRKIYQNWVGIRLNHEPNFFQRHQNLILSIFTVILLLFAVAFAFTLSLKKQVMARTKDLEAAGSKLEANKEYLQAVLDSASDAVFVHEAETGRIVDVNRRMCEMYGYAHAEALQATIQDLSQGESPYSQAEALEWLRKSRETGPQTFDWLARHKDGNIFWVETSIRFSVIGGMDRFVVVVRDITDRKKSSEERDELNAKLFQAQKMESVGQLAGGVAHDYNNMLSVIIGFTELAMDKVDRSDRVYADLNEILSAAKRSAEITRQLLAFARKQTIEPKVLDLNEIVESMLKMLRRLIGEDIDLAWHPENKLWPILIDPSQLEQILANLCVNARDAISGVGKVTIETDTVTFDEVHCTEHPGFVLGEFVLLAVSDDGCGMDRKILDSIFEPFFTTKGENEGTGLGLATVYGIVKQNNGFINVYSELGEGTTFKIYLPKHVGEPEKIRKDVITKIDTGRGELVLIVEDEPMIMKMCEMMLSRLGYTVLAASTPKEAVKLAEEYPGEIHLLLTDVVMPSINGRDLANQLSAIYPGIKILFMSGYTTKVIAHRGILEEGVQFIHKPFTMKDLGMKIREILDDVSG